jgi:hypothetical protein
LAGVRCKIIGNNRRLTDVDKKSLGKILADSIEVTLKDGTVVIHKDVQFVEDGSNEEGKYVLRIYGRFGQVLAQYNTSDFTKFVTK